MTKENKFGEKFPDAKSILQEIEMIVNTLTVNYSKQQFNPIDNNEVAGYIAVKDIQSNAEARTILKRFFKSMGLNPNNIENKDGKESKKYQGIYLFAERSSEDTFNYIYTGISRNVIDRIKGHINKGDKNTASWATLIARHNNPSINAELEKYAYKTLKTTWHRNKKKQALIDLQTKIDEVQKDIISNYYFTFVPVNDNFIMHIAEGFVACALECEWNSFKTH